MIGKLYIVIILESLFVNLKNESKQGASIIYSYIPWIQNIMG